MTYEASPVGHERSVVMHGVSEQLLSDHALLEQTLKDALMADKFTVLDTVRHEFTPQGFALVMLLAESHAALHTYPEFGSLVFSLYSCRREHDGDKVMVYLAEKFKPLSVTEHDHAVWVKK